MPRSPRIAPDRLLTRRLRGLPRVVWILVAGTLITRVGSFAIPFLTIYLHNERGLSTAYAGAALGAWGVGSMVASLTGGALADRVGRKPVVVGAPLLGGGSLVLLVLTRHPVAVLGATFLAGVVSESGRPAVTALLTDVTPPARRVDAVALFRLVINLGFAIGTGLGGLLAATVGFEALFLADAATSWIYAAVALFALPETRPSDLRRGATAGDAGGFRTVAADPVFRRLWTATLVSALVFTQPMSTLALVLTDRGLSTRVYGGLAALNGVLILCAEFWLSGITRRRSPPRVLALGAVLVGVGFALTGLAGASIPLLVATVVIWTTGEMVGAPTSQAYVAAISPVDMRGRYAGAFSLAFSLAFAIGPVLGGVALLGDPLPLWLGALALSGLAAVLYLTLPDVPVDPSVATDAVTPASPPQVLPVGVAARAVGGRLVARLAARPRS